MRKLKQEKKEREMVKEERKMEQELGLGTSAQGTDTKSGKERKSLAVERGRRKEHRKELRQCYGSA